MPAKSAKQYRLMQAAAHGKSKKISPEVAREFVRETPKSLRQTYSKKK